MGKTAKKTIKGKAAKASKASKGASKKQDEVVLSVSYQEAGDSIPMTTIENFLVVDNVAGWEPVKAVLKADSQQEAFCVSIEYSVGHTLEVVDDGNGITLTEASPYAERQITKLDYSVVADLLVALKILSHHDKLRFGFDSTVIRGEKL